MQQIRTDSALKFFAIVILSVGFWHEHREDSAKEIPKSRRTQRPTEDNIYSLLNKKRAS